jgi:hypothetical protein
MEAVVPPMAILSAAIGLSEVAAPCMASAATRADTVAKAVNLDLVISQQYHPLLDHHLLQGTLIQGLTTSSAILEFPQCMPR